MYLKLNIDNSKNRHIPLLMQNFFLRVEFASKIWTSQVATEKSRTRQNNFSPQTSHPCRIWFNCVSQPKAVDALSLFICDKICLPDFPFISTNHDKDQTQPNLLNRLHCNIELCFFHPLARSLVTVPSISSLNCKWLFTPLCNHEPLESAWRKPEVKTHLTW